MQCPACGGALVAAPVPRPHVLHGCSMCGGIFADAATSEHVEAELDEALVGLSERAAANFADRPLPPDQGRRCPVCGAGMARREIAMTDVDVCKIHGTWFDRGELQRVARILEADRASDDVKSSSAPSGVAGDVAGAVAGGVLEILFDVVVSAVTS